MAASLGISETLARCLLRRGFSNVSQAHRFLQPSLWHLQNPFLLPDMAKAVERVRKTLKQKEIILLYGDRDADGLTAISILKDTLETLGAKVFWSVATKDNHQLDADVLRAISPQGVRLVITADTGSGSEEAIHFAKDLGMDTVVTDHHTLATVSREATAVVNPNRPDATEEARICYGGLSGGGVAFKFCEALVASLHPLYEKGYTAFDTETTGFSPPQAELVEIGAVRVRQFLVQEVFQSLIKPQRGIPPAVTEIHGITDEMCEEAPEELEVIPRFIEFVGGEPLVAQNSSFDMAFLNEACQRLAIPFENPVVDTLVLSRAALPGMSHALGSLCESLGIGVGRLHRAVADAEATAELFRRLIFQSDEGLKRFYERNLELAALSTVADGVPLTGECRALVAVGLPRLLTSSRPGLQAIFSREGVSSISAREVSMEIVPLLNSAGRMGKPQVAAGLLLAKDSQEAQEHLAELRELNTERQIAMRKGRRTLEKELLTQFQEEDRFIFLVSTDVNRRMTGALASQIVRRYHRPCAVLVTLNEEEAFGSARSVEGFDLLSAFSKCRDILLDFGGHPMAAGFTLPMSRTEIFRSRLQEIARENIREEDLSPDLTIDAWVRPQDLSGGLGMDLTMLEPFGASNPPPVLAMRGVRLSAVEPLGKREIGISFASESHVFEGRGFGLGPHIARLCLEEETCVAFTLNPQDKIHVLDVQGGNLS